MKRFGTRLALGLTILTFSAAAAQQNQLVPITFSNNTSQTITVFWINPQTDAEELENGGFISPGGSIGEPAFHGRETDTFRFKVGPVILGDYKVMRNYSVHQSVTLTKNVIETHQQGTRTAAGSSNPWSPEIKTLLSKNDVSGDAGSSLTAEDENAILEYHNQLRSAVGVAPLKWSPTLAKVAQRYADELAHSGGFDHSPQRIYGENLLSGNGKPSDMMRAITTSWRDESTYYVPGTPMPKDLWGFKSAHYTQVVWSGTTEVGVGRAIYLTGMRAGCWVIVANYNPPGNKVGQKPY
jgi:pathogenesis-related protein 1